MNIQGAGNAGDNVQLSLENLDGGDVNWDDNVNGSWTKLLIPTLTSEPGGKLFN